MIISCIGDSLTEGDYGVKGKRGIANIHSENYPYFLSKITSAEVHNFGKCGFTSTSYLDFYTSGAVDIAKSDIIIVMLGTNGGLDPENPDAKGNKDYETLIINLKNDAPDAKIVLCTPPHASSDHKMSNHFNHDIAISAGVFVRNFCKKKSIPLIDVGKSDLFTAETESIMQPNDGLHFGCEGYKSLANLIKSNLLRLFPEIKL